jgi:D-alanyl-lipoteichoic acid acyltransferase DltB (MBOAT superfamily)
MARGISRLLGIELIRNFREPYLSRNITSFWRHWHISLSTWFKNYLYIPLGGNRVHYLRSALNLMLVMSIAGLWHGAALTFLVWGMFHGFLLVAHKMWIRSTSEIMLIKSLRIPNIFKICGTFTLVTLGWIFFRADSFQSAIELIGRILGKSTGVFDRIDFLQLLILIVVSFTLDLLIRNYRKSSFVLGVFSSGLVIGFLLTVAFIFRASEIIPFVYFQF